jgi:uncharacterized DUF497 family protein
VKYVYDPAKDRTNQSKHGEVREVAFGVINDRLFVCVYTDRDAERRVISLRRANRREVKRYGENLE